MLYAGIDEAGYGPLLGPLCVGCSAWQIESGADIDAPPDLWQLLKGAVCRKARDRRGRIAINDSKQLKGSGAGGRHPLADIERGVLAALSTLHAAPCCGDADVFERLGSAAPPESEPWYAGGVPLPFACDAPHLSLGASMLRRDLAKAGVRLLGLHCAAVDAGPINDAARRGAVKSSIPWTLVMQHVRHLRAAANGSLLRVAVDRQGGRMRHVDELLREFPSDRLKIEQEDETESRYRLKGASGTLVISFTVDAEAAHLPVALASMTAKYVRELWMLRLNRFFISRVDGLAPTAGYVTDGRRFMDRIRPALDREGIDCARLVRSV
ncbi:MAG: hypothetical protein EBR10_01755 [Planctomycetes bacterium]|nr:hypothetical protein [Planctomycetota bacterium]